MQLLERQKTILNNFEIIIEIFVGILESGKDNMF